LEIWPASDRLGGCAVAELLMPQMALPLSEILIEQLQTPELSEDECHRLELVIEGRTRSTFSHLGWIHEAFAWMESATGFAFSSKESIEQCNAGGGFALFRACSDDGRHHWLKATGEPNTHEFPITLLLSELCPEFLPKLVAIKKEWNAWLSEDAGNPISDPPNAAELISAATSMAKFQLLTIGHTEDLLAAGAFDQRLPVLRSRVDLVIAYLIEAMSRQTSTKAVPLKGDRLLEMGEILRDACLRLEALHIPDTLIHNDLNPGNVLWNGAKCVFTDWSEAAVGNPFLSCERLCQVNPVHADSVRNVYRHSWSHRISASKIEEAIALMPIVAIYACLYGRGDWLSHTGDIQPPFESYARSLTRHMDRAAKDSSLLEALCR
jgi:hypothetical protein